MRSASLDDSQRTGSAHVLLFAQLNKFETSQDRSLVKYDPTLLADRLSNELHGQEIWPYGFRKFMIQKLKGQLASKAPVRPSGN